MSEVDELDREGAGLDPFDRRVSSAAPAGSEQHTDPVLRFEELGDPMDEDRVAVLDMEQ